MDIDQKRSLEVDAYIAGFPDEVQAILEKVRSVIHEAAPEAQEAMKYGIPTFVLNGNLVHFGGYARHIGFYPTPPGIEHFKAELAEYELSKGTVKFSLERPIPYDLIRRVVEFRVAENVEKGAA